MAGLEIRIPYVEFKNKTTFPTRLYTSPTEMLIQQNLLYYSNKVMLKSSLLPLNVQDDIEWSIVDGSTYCSIDASTGELTIDSSAITQMVKVRALSVSNPNLTEEREIVLTHREPVAIEEYVFDISINGLQASYNFIDSSTTYSFTAALDPSVNGYNVVFDIVDGIDYFNVTNINWDNNLTTVEFKFNNPPSEDYNILLKFYVDNMPELTKDVQITVKTLVSDIMFDNIPQSPYMPYEQYSFDFYTDPVVNFRNLDVSVISGREYLDVYYTTDVVGTRGKFNFRRNSREIENYDYLTVRFSDPLDNTIYKDASLIFDNINHNIDVSGNKASYGYNSDKTYYESFTWEETPTYNRELLVIVTQNPANIIDYYTSDVSGGSGRFNFQTKSVTDEGWVNVRIQDPLTTLGKNVTFNIQNGKVARFMSIDGRYNNDTSYMRTVNVVSYGNNLQGYAEGGNSYNIYDTSDNNFCNELYSRDELNDPANPRRHYTGVNLYDTSLYIEFDYIPENTKERNNSYNTYADFIVKNPIVQYELDSSRSIAYSKTVDISTNLPKGTYFAPTKEWRNSSLNDYGGGTGTQITLLGQRNYMVLDSSHFGNDYNNESTSGLWRNLRAITNPRAVYTDIPHIKDYTSATRYVYLDPSANIISTYFNNIEGNKELSITKVEVIRYVNLRPADTDEYFYRCVGVDNIVPREMSYIKYYAPAVIDYIRNYLHLNGNIAKIIYNDKYVDGGDPYQWGDLNIEDSSIFSPYAMSLYKSEHYYNTGWFYSFDGFTSGLVTPIPAGTYDIEINYKADIVPIDYTINVKVNVS